MSRCIADAIIVFRASKEEDGKDGFLEMQRNPLKYNTRQMKHFFHARFRLKNRHRFAMDSLNLNVHHCPTAQGRGN
jgi:hypothetical protein